MTPSSLAGVITAAGTALTGIALVISAITIYRKQRTTEAKVDEVHRLVDGNLTAAKVDQLDAMRRDLVSMREVRRLRMVTDRDPDVEADGIIAHTEARIAELNAEIIERRSRESQMSMLGEQS